jgi:carboxyl-terminal processing protease
MKKFTGIFLSGFILLGFVLTSCAGFPAVEEGTADTTYGPSYNLQDLQKRTFEALWNAIEENYIYFESADVNWDSLHDDYLKRIESGLTPAELDTVFHDLESELPNGGLVYQSRQERIEQDLTDTSTYGGIGAFVGFVPEDVPHLVVLDVMTGSPAEKAGLKAHDSILEIDGEAVQLEEGLGAVERVRGQAGSSVDLTIQTPGRPERTIEIERAQVSGTGQLKYGDITGTNYGYLLFPPTSYETMTEDVLQSLQELTSNRKLEGLILDLRIAGSRAGWPLEELLTLFGDGVAGVFYNRAESQTVRITGQNIAGSQSVPLVIFIGENTSGSPEILAASLQASKRATVIGVPTEGAVEGVSVFYLPDGSRIFVESTSFHLPGADETVFNGVQPDVLIEAGWDDVLPNNDPLIDESIKILEAVQ